jgi:hypothetical protein
MLCRFRRYRRKQQKLMKLLWNMVVLKYKHNALRAKLLMENQTFENLDLYIA